MTLVLQIIIGIFILGILVLIHESGHFTAAKIFGIRVLSFSIGFGKPLITKTVGGTEYRISSIPFGGYVHMAGDHPEDKHEKADDGFSSKPIWQRAVVAIAGPAANVISSIIFLWFVFIVGIPHELYLDKPVIGAVADSSGASQAGLAPGDSITSINNTPVHSWEDIQKHFSRQEATYNISIFRKGINKNTTIEMPLNKSGDLLQYHTAGLMPKYPARIGAVNPGSPAEKSGIHPNDLIIGMNNITIHSWFQVSNIVSEYNPFLGPLQIIIQRADSLIIISAEPSYDKDKNRFLLGIAVASPPTRTIRYNAAAALPKALEKSWEYTTMIFYVLSKIATRAISPKQLAGPIGIIQISGAVALGSLVALLNLMALIGINLGVLNLFPLIITDGGVLFFLIIESIRKKPLSLKTQLLMNRIAISLFIALFLFVTFNDILRIPQLFRMVGK